MRVITDNLLKAVAIVAVMVGLLFYHLMAGYAVDASFVSVSVIPHPAVGADAQFPGAEKVSADPKKVQALAGWIGAHSWGWGRGRPKAGFGPDELLLELVYPNGSHAQLAVQKDTIGKTDQDGLVWRLLSPQEHNELKAIFAD